MLAMVSALVALVPDEHPTGLADMVFRDAFFPPPRTFHFRCVSADTVSYNAV